MSSPENIYFDVKTEILRDSVVVDNIRYIPSRNIVNLFTHINEIPVNYHADIICLYNIIAQSARNGEISIGNGDLVLYQDEKEDSFLSIIPNTERSPLPLNFQLQNCTEKMDMKLYSDIIYDWYKNQCIKNGKIRIPLRNINDLYKKYNNIEHPLRDNIEKIYELMMKEQGARRVNLLKKNAYYELPIK